MKIKTNLEQVIEIDDNKSVVIFYDKFLSYWGGHDKHYGVILSDDPTAAAYLLRLHSYTDKNIKNIRINTLKSVINKDISIYNGFPIANIKPLSEV